MRPRPRPRKTGEGRKPARPPAGGFNEAAAAAAENRATRDLSCWRSRRGFNEAAAAAAENRRSSPRSAGAGRSFNEAAAAAAENLGRLGQVAGRRPMLQ